VTTPRMAVRVRRGPTFSERLLALMVSGGLGYIALQCLVAGIKGPLYGGFLFGLFFLSLAGIALRLAVRE
jgi:hypothetical protein